MIIIFEDDDKFLNRNIIYDVVPKDTLFINAYNIGNSIVSDRVFEVLQSKNFQVDNRNYI